MKKLIDWFKNLDQKWKALIITFTAMFFSWQSLMLISFLITGFFNGLLIFFAIVFSCLAVFFFIKLFSFLPKKRAIFIIAITVVGGLFLIFSTHISFNGGCNSNKEGCSICGDPIFSGKFCEKHFNDWGDWADSYYD